MKATGGFLSGGAPFANGNSVEIGRLDKPEATYRLPPSGGGRSGVFAANKAIDGSERGRRVILPQER